MRRSGPRTAGNSSVSQGTRRSLRSRCGAQAIMPRPTSGVRSSAIITLIIPSAQCPARAEVDANVPVRLLRRAVRSIRTILAPFLRALRMNGRAWRFVGNRRSSYILITLPTATFGMSYLRIFNRGAVPVLVELSEDFMPEVALTSVVGYWPSSKEAPPTAWQNERDLGRNFRIGRFVLARTSRAQCASKLSGASTWRGASRSGGHLSSELHPRHAECRFGTVLVLGLGAPTLPISGERRL